MKNLYFNTENNGTGFSTNPKCMQGHTWTYAGAFHYNLEGMPCDCGQVLFHTEKCPCCNQDVQKHIPTPSIKNENNNG